MKNSNETLDAFCYKKKKGEITFHRLATGKWNAYYTNHNTDEQTTISREIELEKIKEIVILFANAMDKNKVPKIFSKSAKKTIANLKALINKVKSSNA